MATAVADKPASRPTPLPPVSAQFRLPSAPVDPGILPAPAELSAVMSVRPAVTLLIDIDALSHTSPGTRLANAELSTVMDTVSRTVASIASSVHRRYAASVRTGNHHADLLFAVPNNTWAVRRGLDGADAAILAELDALAAARPHGPHLVVLVANDHIYAEPVRLLRDLGVPTWLLHTGRQALSGQLYAAATGATKLPSQPTPPIQLAPPTSRPTQRTTDRDRIPPRPSLRGRRQSRYTSPTDPHGAAEARLVRHQRCHRMK